MIAAPMLLDGKRSAGFARFERVMARREVPDAATEECKVRIAGWLGIVATTAIFASPLACLMFTPPGDASTVVDSGADTGTGACTPGTTMACTCTDGRAGSQSCNAAGTGFGTCTCTGGCSVTAGAACTSTEQCCAINGTPTVCAPLPGAGQICSARCGTNADCATGCCAVLADGTRACTVARWCAAPGSCTVAVGGACNVDEQCCPDTGNGFASACSTGSSGVRACFTLCENNARCVSSCCRARSDGLRTCRPTSECQ